MNIYKRFGISDSFLDALKSINEKKALDPVDPKQAKGTFQARKDKDIDNDGKVTGTDKYLHARRNAISKAMSEKKEVSLGKKEKVDVEPEIDDSQVSDRVNEQDKQKQPPPFTPDKPKKSPSALAGKYGQGPSTAKHLAKMGLKKVMAKEEVEEVEELNQMTLSKYAAKARAQSMDKNNPKRYKRGSGAAQAYDKLNRGNYSEEVEVQDTACTPIEEAVSVKKQNYSWGKMVTVHHGAETSYPLHPEHQAKIKALGDGEKTSFKDETKRTVTAHRVGDQIHLSGSGSSKKTPVARRHFTEEVEEIEELSKSTLASYAKKAVTDARFKQGIGKDYEALGKRKRDPETKAMFARMGRKVRMKAQSREAGAAKAIDRLAKEDVDLTQEDREFIEQLNTVDEARFEKGQDVGKPGKMFSKIAKQAAARYGSKEAGQRVAGAVLKKVLKK